MKNDELNMNEIKDKLLELYYKSCEKIPMTQKLKYNGDTDSYFYYNSVCYENSIASPIAEINNIKTNSEYDENIIISAMEQSNDLLIEEGKKNGNKYYNDIAIDFYSGSTDKYLQSFIYENEPPLYIITTCYNCNVMFHQYYKLIKRFLLKDKKLIYTIDLEMVTYIKAILKDTILNKIPDIDFDDSQDTLYITIKDYYLVFGELYSKISKDEYEIGLKICDNALEVIAENKLRNTTYQLQENIDKLNRL